MKALLFSQLNLERLSSGELAFCLAAFMLGPRNMRLARGVSLYIQCFLYTIDYFVIFSS